VKDGGKVRAGVFSVPVTAAQVLLEDFSILGDWPWRVRLALMLAGFALDLFFSVRFLLRLHSALSGEKKGYRPLGRGAADFFSSVPVLVLWSGPVLLGLLASAPGGAAAVGLLSLFRTGRHLRLLRPLAGISGRAAAAAVLAVAAVTALGIVQAPPAPALEETGAFVSTLEPGALAAFARAEERLLLVRKEGRVLYRRFGDRRIRDDFGPFDLLTVPVRGTECLFSLKPRHAAGAREDLAAAFMLLALLPLLREKLRKSG